LFAPLDETRLQSNCGRPFVLLAPMKQKYKVLKFRALLVLLITLPVIGLSGCQAIADIFKAGVWVGVIIVIIILAIIFGITRMFKK